MSTNATKERTVTLPRDFQEFAEECVRSGKNASVDEVVRNAFLAFKIAALCEALDEGINELSMGRGEECDPCLLMDKIEADLGLTY